MGKVSMSTGSCQCGQIQYTVEGESLMTYACHCKDCQKRTGSAFSMGAVYPLTALSVTGELTAWKRVSDDGHSNTRFSCSGCGNIIYGVGSATASIIKLQPGTLDASENVTIDAHIWTRSAQAWLQLPEGVVTHETQPDDLMELYKAVLENRQQSTNRRQK